MKRSYFLFIGALAAALGLTACSSPAGPLGEARVGDTPEMVRTEIGAPDKRQDGPEAGASIWVYTNYVKKRPEATGWSQVLVPGTRDQHDHATQDPVTREVYSAKLQEDLQLVFTEGKVSSIDYVKR